jgi:hypothetical protein
VTKGALAGAIQQLEQAQMEDQSSTTRVATANVRATELELQLGSSERTSQQRHTNWRNRSNTSNPHLDIRHTKDQADAMMQEAVTTLQSNVSDLKTELKRLVALCEEQS